VQVHSEVGCGSTFRLYLPRSPADALSSEASVEPAEVRGGTETVLLVEDEPALRAMNARVLADLGYRVLEARSGVDALDVWERHGTDVDLLLTDLVMPEGLGGLDLAARLQLARPTLKVLCTSGYSAMAIAADLQQMPRFAFLAKPFEPHALARAVRASLDEA
jgi:two-component system cell cycle sensor histidine kinase/response regulator CckA